MFFLCVLFRRLGSCPALPFHLLSEMVKRTTRKVSRLAAVAVGLVMSLAALMLGAVKHTSVPALLLQPAADGGENVAADKGVGTLPASAQLKLDLRRIPGAGYTMTSADGLRAKALLAQATKAATKGREDLEAASAAHLQVAAKSKMLQTALAKKRHVLKQAQQMEAKAEAAQDHAARALLRAKHAMQLVTPANERAAKADLEVRAASAEAVATDRKARAAFERAIQDAIVERKSADGIVASEKNIAAETQRLERLKKELLSSDWQPWDEGADDADLTGAGWHGMVQHREVVPAVKRGRYTRQRRGRVSRFDDRAAGVTLGRGLGSVGDKLVHTQVGEPLVHFDG